MFLVLGAGKETIFDMKPGEPGRGEDGARLLTLWEKRTAGWLI